MSHAKQRPLKRLLTLLMTLALVLGLLPVAAFAASGDIQAGLPAFILGADDSDGSNASDKPTVVAFDGHLWDVIGYDGVGVSSTDTDTLTLLADSNDPGFGTRQFGSNNIYDGSDLQGVMNDHANTLGSLEKSLVVLTALPDVNINAQSQSFWPLSADEAGQLNTALLPFSDDWWLRTPVTSYGGDHVAYVYSYGNIVSSGGQLPYTLAAVRPAFNLDLSHVAFTSAVDGKPDTFGPALTKATALTDGTPLKFTVTSDYDGTTNPDGLALTCTDDASRTVKAGDTVDIDYTGATFGFTDLIHDYVSCVIEDSGGDVLYYGKLADCADSYAAAGTAEFTVPSLPAGNYTIKLFSEQCPGSGGNNNYTDFCSTPVDISMTVQPTVVSVTPNNTTAPLSGNIVVTFSEAMDDTAGTVSLDNGGTALTGGIWSNGNTVYTVPYSGLAYNTTYAVTLSGFQSAHGTQMADDSSHGFTTKSAGGSGGANLPPTGDSTSAAIIAAALLASMLVAVGLFAWRRRQAR